MGIAKVRQSSAKEGGGGLRASELEAIIRNAVEDALEPMQRRVETLEAIVTDDEPMRPSAERRLDPAVLADVLEAPDEIDEPVAARRRTRE